MHGTLTTRTFPIFFFFSLPPPVKRLSCVLHSFISPHFGRLVHLGDGGASVQRSKDLVSFREAEQPESGSGSHTLEFKYAPDCIFYVTSGPGNLSLLSLLSYKL